MLLKYILKNYSFKALIYLLLDEYLWSILKHLPGLEGIMMRRFYLTLGAKKAGAGATVQRAVHLKGIEKLEFGDNLYINRGCHIDAFGGVCLGNNVGIGPYTVIITNDHGFITGGTDYYNRKFVGRPVEIGDGTIIGANCYINPGVKIGQNCVIAAGSSVFADVPDGQIVGPAAMTGYFKAVKSTLREYAISHSKRLNKKIPEYP